MIYLFLGEDVQKKNADILALKKKFIPSADALQFDYDVLYGQKLDASALKQSLIALPAVAPRRLIVLHQAHELSQQNKALIEDFASAGSGQTVLVLESDAWSAKDSFVKKIASQAKISDYSRREKSTIFNVTRLISARRTVQAMKELHELIEAGEYPLQMMGGIVWFWGQQRRQMGPRRFEEGLLALKEADLNIKRSRVSPEHAVEILVVKLCGIVSDGAAYGAE